MGSRLRLRLPSALALWALALSTLTGGGLQVPCPHDAGPERETQSAASAHAGHAPHAHSDEAPSPSCEGFCLLVCGLLSGGTGSGPDPRSLVLSKLPLRTLNPGVGVAPEGANPGPSWILTPHALPLSQAPPEGTRDRTLIRA